jgi:hypothetical protein
METQKITAVRHEKGTKVVKYSTDITGVPTIGGLVDWIIEKGVHEQILSALIRQAEQTALGRCASADNANQELPEEQDFYQLITGTGTGRFSYKKAAEQLQAKVDELQEKYNEQTQLAMAALSSGDTETATMHGNTANDIMQDIKEKQEKIGEHLAAHAEQQEKRKAAKQG